MPWAHFLRSDLVCFISNSSSKWLCFTGSLQCCSFCKKYFSAIPVPLHLAQAFPPIFSSAVAGAPWFAWTSFLLECVMSLPQSAPMKITNSRTEKTKRDPYVSVHLTGPMVRKSFFMTYVLNRKIADAWHMQCHRQFTKWFGPLPLFTQPLIGHWRDPNRHFSWPHDSRPDRFPQKGYL